MDVIIFFLLCVIGWQGFARMKLPAPTVLGPMFLLSFVSFLGVQIIVPGWLKPSLSVIMGIFLGLRFNLSLRGMGKYILLAGTWIVSASYLTTKVLVFLGLPEATAVFSAMPGGLIELTLVAMSFGANTFTVALLQSSRLFLTMLIIPFILKRLSSVPSAAASCKEERVPVDWTKWAGVVMVGVAAALLLGKTGMPAAALIGPMLGVGLLTRVFAINLKVNRDLQQFVQIAVGGLIGLNTHREAIMGISDYIFPMVSLNVLIIGSSIILGFLLHKITGWDLVTCLLSTAPAGLTPMILLSMELKADSSRVAVFQVLRLVTVVLIAPYGAHIFTSG